MASYIVLSRPPTKMQQPNRTPTQSNRTKAIVNYAKEKQAAIVFENIEGIRNLYQKGNYQSKNDRAKMNTWPFYMLKEQITYKAEWEGVPVIQLTKGETRGTSQFCPRCGKRTQVAARDDMQHKRQLWCETCERWQDRDVIAAMNIARKGWLRFDHPQGAASEAMVQESGSKELVILKVDAAKLGQYGMKAPSEPKRRSRTIEPDCPLEIFCEGPSEPSRHCQCGYVGK